MLPARLPSYAAWDQPAIRFNPAPLLRLLSASGPPLLLPTRYDPFANVTLEAAAAGRPVVTSAANGAAEWLGDDIRVVSEAEDAGGFAEALDSLREAAPRRALGERARLRARDLDWPGHVEALRDEYARIVETHRRRASA